MGAANMNPDLAASRAVTRPVARAGPRRDRLVARVLGRRAIPFVGAAVVAIVGEMVVRAGWAPSSVAAPTDVWREFINDPNSLWFEVQPTLSASLVGFAYATGIALAVSVLTAVVPWATGVIYRVSVVTYSVPLIALTPVLLVWIGNGQSLASSTSPRSSPPTAPPSTATPPRSWGAYCTGPSTSGQPHPETSSRGSSPRAAPSLIFNGRGLGGQPDGVGTGL
jgi:hypothetical protein